MIIHNVEQGSEEWHALRAGIPTASEFSKLVSGGGKLSASLEPFAKYLAAEIRGAKIDRFENFHTRRGNELEESAKLLYSLQYEMVQEVGFITDDEITCGYSPDGLVGEDGLIEIKCLSLPEFIKVLDKGEVPLDYISQIQGGMMITWRKWCDFVAFYPTTEGEDLLFVKRVFPDLEFQEKLKGQIKKCNEVRDKFFVEKLGGTLKSEPAQTALEEGETINF